MMIVEGKSGEVHSRQQKSCLFFKFPKERLLLAREISAHNLVQADQK
jgi:hypothetical protein